MSVTLAIKSFQTCASPLGKGCDDDVSNIYTGIFSPLRETRASWSEPNC